MNRFCHFFNLFHYFYFFLCVRKPYTQSKIRKKKRERYIMYFASFIIYNNINVHIFPLLMSFFSRICCQFDDVSIDAFGQLKFDDKRFWKLLTTPPHLCFFAEFLSLFHSIIQRICSAFRWL